MLSSDDIIHHFAARLVYAIESGLSRAAIDIYREWRVYVATNGPRHGQDVELQAQMRALLAATTRVTALAACAEQSTTEVALVRDVA